MAANYILLERIELNNTASSVTFSNIPQTGYTDLKLVYSGRTDRSGAITSDIYLQFNGITTATYSFKRIYGTGTGSPASDGLTNNAQGGFAGAADGASGTANTFSNAEVYIPNYVGGSAKAWSVDAVTEHNGTGVLTTLQAGLWSGTSAITSITVKDYNAANWVAGSTFSLYGVAALGTTPAVAPKADGGNVIATDGTYWYHAFLSNGTFTPQTNLTADVLVVAGGGGGGTSTAYNGAGGGGAGGVLAFSSQFLASSTACTVTIGAGGATNANGVNSQFAALTASVGGGKGGSGNAVSGSTGGSGGGAGSNASGGAGTSGQGYAGASCAYNSAGGGGGGSGAAASAVTAAGQGGNGGAGLNTWSSWLSATALGVSGYIAGGGGGGSYTGYGTATGSAGGGNGGVAAVGANATANTGSGGGAGGNDASGYAGGAGGSGIIIIRYPIAS